MLSLCLVFVSPDEGETPLGTTKSGDRMLSDGPEGPREFPSGDPPNESVTLYPPWNRKRGMPFNAGDQRQFGSTFGVLDLGHNISYLGETYLLVHRI